MYVVFCDCALFVIVFIFFQVIQQFVYGLLGFVILDRIHYCVQVDDVHVVSIVYA